jgi:hypothetical protein
MSYPQRIVKKDLGHFILQDSYIAYSKDILSNKTVFPEKDPRNSMFVTDPELANVYIIDHRWVGTYCPVVLNDHLIPIIHDVIHKYPYFNRSYGHDHFFFAVYDSGPVCLPACASFDNTKNSGKLSIHDLMKLIWNVTFIGNYGMDYKYIFDPSNIKLYAGKTCHRTGKDIVMPQMIKKKTYDYVKNHFGIYNLNRPDHSCFRGMLHGDRKVLALMKQNAQSDYGNGTELFNWYYKDLKKCFFAYCPCGQACWSMRLYEAIALLTIPILIADGVIQPFERFIDWRKFTVKLGVDVYHNNSGFHSFRKHLRSEIETFQKNMYDAETIDILPESQFNLSHPDHFHQARWSSLRNTYIFRKIEYMFSAIEWFDFRNPLRIKNAYRLLHLEMWCRITKFRLSTTDSVNSTGKNFNHKICRRKADFIARIQYF